MKGKGTGIAASVFIGIALIGFLAAGFVLRSEAFMERAGATAAEKAAELLGVPMEVGSIEVESFHSLVIRDIAVYDKQAECIARAEEARVNFRLFSALQENPAAAVDEVVLHHVSVNLVQRPDGTWNAEDIETSEGGENAFRGKVVVEDGTLRGNVQGKELVLENVTAGLDMADYPVMKVEASAENQGAKIQAGGTLGKERQILTAHVEGVDLENYFSLVPEGLIPENVKIVSGEIPKAKAAILRQGDVLSFSGQAEYQKGVVQVEGTEIRDIHGFATFTDSELMLFTDAESMEQKAHMHGKLRWDTGAPYMDLYANSDSFDPGAILPTIPFQGAVDFQAHVAGSFTNPTVDGDFHVASGRIEDIQIQNAAAHVYFADHALYLQDVSAGMLDGTVKGEGELRLDDMAYTAHVKTGDVEAAYFADYIPGVSGRLSADLGISGQGTGMENLEIYGSVRAKDAFYQELPITDLSASFYAKGQDVTIDYLSLQMPNHSDIGLEGTIKDGNDLDLSFYGGHVDFSMLSKLVPQADITGFGDFEGKIKGGMENPQVGIRLSCLKGTLFQQPFDSLKASMGGSLDGIGIREFFMEKDGHEVWQVKGYVGFVGEKRIDLQADTVGARMEDIAALVAPDQPITGNVDNTIRVTGTLDNPHAVGYIHMYRGSYRGMLVIGMDGDYFLEGDKVRLQDARIRTPMIDMDVSGTLDYKTMQMDMDLSVYDIDMKRLENRFPYEVSGHGTFSGKASGTIDEPVFRGILDAPELVLNEQSITQVHGEVEYAKNQVTLREFGFDQKEGRYRLNVGMGMDAYNLSGSASVRNADINALLAMLDQKNDKIQGRLDADAVLGGSLDNPSVRMSGSILSGLLAGYDVHDVAFQASIADRVLAVEKLTGSQGETGHFDALASISMDGPIQGTISAHDLEAGLFTKLAGLDTEVVGLADVEASIGDVLQNPSANVSVNVRNGGIQGSTFDNLHGVFLLKNGLVDVQELMVQKMVAEKNYQASAKGIVPLRAVFATAGEELDDYEQIKLGFSLDEADLSLLPLLSDHVDWALGEMDGNVEITGTLAHPLAHGSIRVPAGSLKIKELEKPITDMQLNMIFRGNVLDLEEFSGSMGEGNYRAVGSLALDGTSLSKYDFQVDMDQLDVQSDFYRGPLSGQFHVGEGEFEWLDRTIVRPKLTGNLQLEHCLISVPAIPETEGEMPEAFLDVSVELGKKVHFYSPSLYDMYLTGTAHFEGSTRYPKTSGMISVRRGGTFTYLKNVFNIREGEISFNQVDSFVPSMSFFADTRLGRTKIFLWGKGPLGSDQMQLRLTSSPEMSQTEIIQMLTFRSSYKDGKATFDVSDLLLTGLQMSILADLENSMKEILYLDVFSVSHGSGSAFGKDEDDDYYSLTVGKYFGDKLLLRYTQGFGTGSDKHRFGMTYEFNDRIGLTVEQAGSESIVGLEARIKF